MWDFFLLQSVPTEVPFYVRLIDASIALAVALGIGIPLWSWQRKQIDNLTIAKDTQMKEYADRLEKKDQQVFEMAIETQRSLKEITSVVGQFQSQSITNDVEVRRILSELNSNMSKLSVVMETILKFKGGENG